MNWVVQNLWLIPVLPLLAAGATAVTRQPFRRFSAGLAIGSMVAGFFLSCAAFLATLGRPAGPGIWREFHNFNWFQIGGTSLQLGWVLDPLAAAMLVMVTLVGLLIFIYSIGYMGQDENFTRFFCFMALFAAAMLGVVIANSLLLLFICWELVGLASYLLIGFWYHKPSAAAAAKKAFITTRIGDIGFFLGMLWLYSQTGTLLLYDGGNGCLEQSALTKLVAQTTMVGLSASTGIALLIFCGAVGKSGQVPLHVWLPDAMEGPTPVSALIHAATMVAAGVFLVARVYPLMDADASGLAGISAALTVVTWVGAITAVFAASIAVAQTDIKRILAYSTVSQLGYMMMGLGVGGIAIGIFHLITHAFFKALLFLGAGSVIHGCHDEQDIRRMGGVKTFMPWTFWTYAVGMMALSGVPLFAGFWSKDAILHAAHGGPFYLGLLGALLTAFYMTRQVCYVFFGAYRGQVHEKAAAGTAARGREGHAPAHTGGHGSHEFRESPAVMTVPLVILAVFAATLGFVGTPAWPGFQHYLTGPEAGAAHEAFGWKGLSLMLLSTLVVLSGIGLGWWLYGRKPVSKAEDIDTLEQWRPDLFAVLRQKYYIDELYDATVVRFNAWWAKVCGWLDRWIWGGAVQIVSLCVVGFSWLNRFFDEYVINLGFDEGCGRFRRGGRFFSGLQDGQVQNYLRVIGVALTFLILVLTWGCRAS